MNNIRFDDYTTLLDRLPLSLKIFKLTPYNLSREQNWHENPEIQLCTSGEGSVLVDGKIYFIQKDDIIVINSKSLHYTFTEDFLEYACLILNTKWCRQMNIDYNRINFDSFVCSKSVVAHIKNLMEIQSNSNTILSVAKSSKILLEILIELIENHSTDKTTLHTNDKHFDVVKNAIIFIQNNFNKKITLDLIATHVNYDKYALCREFKKYIGNTIFSYLNRYRTLQAVDYLLQGYNVTETSLLCGFENASFFTKTFKKYTGKLPSQYK